MYNPYNKKEDEREKLTPEMIFAYQKKRTVEDIILSAVALIVFVLFWIVAVARIIADCNENTTSLPSWLITVPILLGVCFFSCCCIHQWFQTVSAIRCAWGKKYRLETDTLERIAENECEPLPFFSFKRYWVRGRGNRYARARQNTVTAYYFTNSGRASSHRISVHDGDFEGDSFYLVIREKDGVILTVYNAKKYRLDSQEN